MPRPLFLRCGVLSIAAWIAAGCNGLAGIHEPLEGPSDVETPPDAFPPADVRDSSSQEQPDLGPPLRPDASGQEVSTDSAPRDAGPTTIRYRNMLYSTADRTKTIEVTIPKFVEPDDLLWLTIYTDLANTEVSAPTGWEGSEIRNSTHDFHSWWFWRFAAVNDAGTEWFSLNYETKVYTAIVVYSGVDPRSPFDRGTFAPTTGSPCKAPSIHPEATSGLLFLAAFINDEAHSWKFPSASPDASRNVAFTARVDNIGLFVGDFPQDFAGDTPEVWVDCSPPGDGAVAVVSLVPAR